MAMPRCSQCFSLLSMILLPIELLLSAFTCLPVCYYRFANAVRFSLWLGTVYLPLSPAPCYPIVTLYLPTIVLCS